MMKHFKEVHFGMHEDQETSNFPTYPEFLSSREQDYRDQEAEGEGEGEREEEGEEEEVEGGGGGR
jgi:hypothetical protein